MTPPWGRTDFNPCSPCGERRKTRGYVTVSRTDFNPCSPCGERPLLKQMTEYPMGFQSMLPVRGATATSRARPRSGSHFNPCSPCGERHVPLCHGLRHLQFQSMLPVRGATIGGLHHEKDQLISIHAPRAGSDGAVPGRLVRDPYFNPCSPCGERRTRHHNLHKGGNFNPCSPCGERLRGKFGETMDAAISIHAPRAGSDYLRGL